jgi:hypothetical protein
MTTLSKESGIRADANGPTSSVLNDGSETGLRPPYLTRFEATDEPLIVLPAFLSRADSTPQADRPRDPKNVVGHDGHPIAKYCPLNVVIQRLGIHPTITKRWLIGG